MTAGALYQIKLNTNSANNFLDFDPQISFFKKVYRKHTRFSMESIQFDPLNRQKLDFDDKVTMLGNVPRNGDLLKNVYFTFNLPAIYSGKNLSGSTNNFNFKWIENIGANIFNFISIKISDQEIDRIWSDYYVIWKELMLSSDKKNVMNKSIGHIPELYDPANAPGNNANYPHIITSQGDIADRWTTMNTSSYIATFSTKRDNSIPSIDSQTIRVPLNFWFCNDPGLALPLISLQYSNVSFELEMKAFKDLYTVLDPSSGKRVKPTSDSTYNMSNFAENYLYDINPKLEGEFIFLDEEERRRFALNDHDYLITQSRLTERNGVELKQTHEEVVARLVPAFNPVSFITWVIKRDDLSHVNDWNNYTNWVYPDIPPNSYEATLGTTEKKYNLSGSTDIFYSHNNHDSQYNNTNFKKHILNSVRIEFDGAERIEKNADYFKKQQIYQHFNTDPKDGIYVYSFSLNPTEYQPSGSCNFSNINLPRIIFKKDAVDDFTLYNYRAYIWIVSYNILTISNGIGNMKFTN